MNLNELKPGQSAIDQMLGEENICSHINIALERAKSLI